MSAIKPVADWTTGTEAISYQACSSCQSPQYFRRAFCAACGAPDPVDRIASGQGTVYAASLVLRAATAEGFRMMAHGAHDLVIGDQVRARYARFTGRLVPYFERTSS
jgi:uncharacterized OB-fold protein